MMGEEISMAALTGWFKGTILLRLKILFENNFEKIYILVS